tara:strand:+ start:120 stop:566 length:447 start_codon:yes stop_codon:yes gene_type:complete
MNKILIIFLLLLVSCTAEMPSDNYTPIPTTFVGKDLEFFNELNQMRVSRNLPPLKAEKKLKEGCIQHSTYMFSLDSLNHDYFYSRYMNSNTKGFAEVVCYGYNTSLSQISAYESSVSHNQVLINPIFTHVGIANVGLYQTVNLGYYAK